jgi:hypothetical protein
VLFHLRRNPTSFGVNQLVFSGIRALVNIILNPFKQV